MGRIDYYNQIPYLIDHIDFFQISRQDYLHTACRSVGRPRYALIRTARGQMRYDFAEGTVYVDAGDAVFIPAGACYTSYYGPEGSAVEMIQFDLIRGSLPDCFSAPMIIGRDELKEAFLQIRKTIPQDPIGLMCRVYEILNSSSRHCSDLPAPYRRLQPALDALERHYERDLSIEDYAKMCLVSQSLFRRLFREYTGMAPLAYRNQLRLERARRLIDSGEFSVAEAAQQVGFSNLSFFYRLYKRTYGASPGKST